MIDQKMTKTDGVGKKGSITDIFSPTSNFVRNLATPLSKKGWPRWLVFIFAIIGIVYLLNPTFGFDFLPDNLPIVGNLDEGMAAMLVLWGLVEIFEGGKKSAPTQPAATPTQQPTEPKPTQDDELNIIEINNSEE